jgi:hypothetical protein
VPMPVRRCSYRRSQPQRLAGWGGSPFVGQATLLKVAAHCDDWGMTTRRFAAPWRADKMIPGGYVVRDANGQALVNIYSRENEAEALQAKVLTADEARRIAINVAKLQHVRSERSVSLPDRHWHDRNYGAR